MVFVGGWRCSRSWVCLLVVLLSYCVDIQARDPLVELLAQYPLGYQGIAAYKRGDVMPYKRNSGVPDECRGKYDTSIYTTLDNICEDCYNLYKEADVHQFCRADCFSTSYFQRCLQALLLEEDRYINMAQIIGRR